MADDRPVQDATDAIAALQAQLDDLKSTLLARTSSRPTGDIEPTVRTAAKTNTLLLQGQAVSRTTYAVLWRWVQDQSLVVAGLFTTGDGSTTFGLPDFRGRVPVGASPLAVGALVGADTVTLTAAQMPAHDHGGASSAGSHAHGGSTGADSGHTGHFPGTSYLVPGGTTYGLAAWNSGGNFSADAHYHNFNTALDGVHTHPINSAGSGSSFDNRQASIAINWLIYT